MATDTSKVSSRLAALNLSLDELEAELEPLLSQSLPETLVGLDTIQQAKLQVLLPYLLYDLIFIYLKMRGVDPKTHPVVAELDRVRQYFNKIKDAEDPAKRTMAIDKAAANRFIKHAIAQVKYGRPPGQDEEVSTVRVPVKVTSKMVARAEYEEQLREEGSEEEEEDLQVFDEAEDEAQSGSSSSNESKGKGKAVAMENSNVFNRGQKRRRQAVDPSAGYGEEGSPDERPSKSSKSTPTTSTPTSDAEAPSSTPVSDAASSAKAKKAAKKARKKARKQAT
ncbi:hypothetical protein EIP86_002624 [Pleurotus ostreatoroseus]|nr:hypothetical protein EIP86_002624 [Pleurotus ostreatoroseus]